MCDNNKQVLSGGPYSESGTSHDFSQTLPPSKYKFIIKDSEGDGIYSASYGYGSYSVYWEGALVKQGGEFGTRETAIFGTECP